MGLAGTHCFYTMCGIEGLNHLPYCSAVCCSASVKHALTLAEAYPEIETEIFYIDLRLTGRNEKLLRKAEKTGTITFTKGKVGRIGPGDESGRIILEVEDIMAGKKRMDSFDMVVLATGLVPNPLILSLAANEYGFYDTTQLQGIYPAATCKRPMDVSASVKDATAAAIKSMFVSDERRDKHIALAICTGCGIGETIDTEKLGLIAREEVEGLVCHEPSGTLF